MKHILPLLLAVIMLLSFTGCTRNKLETEDTTPKETTSAKEFDYYIGNKSTKVYHDPDCKYLPSKANQVKIQKNRSGFAKLDDYQPCWHCQPEPPEIK